MEPISVRLQSFLQLATFSKDIPCILHEMEQSGVGLEFVLDVPMLTISPGNRRMDELQDRIMRGMQKQPSNSSTVLRISTISYQS